MFILHNNVYKTTPELYTFVFFYNIGMILHELSPSCNVKTHFSVSALKSNFARAGVLYRKNKNVRAGYSSTHHFS